MATDPKLACQNFVNALERIPKVIESHEKEMAKVVANKDVYTNIANSSWKKEDELRSLKSEAAELDRKIALTISTNKEAKGDVEQDNSISISGLPNQIDNLRYMKTVRMVVHKVFVQNGGTNSPIHKRLDFR